MIGGIPEVDFPAPGQGVSVFVFVEALVETPLPALTGEKLGGLFHGMVDLFSSLIFGVMKDTADQR